MLGLRKSILSHLLYSASSTTSNSSLHILRLLSATAPQISPNPRFAVEDYLVDTCGLTCPQALKASTKLSHLSSPSRPDAVVAFLRGLGLSNSDLAAAVAKDPQFLCAGVETTLGPIVADLTGLGLSRSEIARLIPLIPCFFRRRAIRSKLEYYLPLFGSFENLHGALKRNNHLLGSSIDRVVRPNVAILRECGLGACDIAKLCVTSSRLLATNPDRIRAMVACAQGLGVPRGCGMFNQVFKAVLFLSEDKITAKTNYLKKTFGWSDAEVGIAVSKSPFLLRRSKDSLQRRSQLLLSEIGLDPLYIAQRSVMLGLSLEGRLRPRYFLLRFLKDNQLVKRKRNFYSAVAATEKLFKERFICPYEEAAPGLAQDYVGACRGEVPDRFKFA